jgi:antitoxin MazE
VSVAFKGCGDYIVITEAIMRTKLVRIGNSRGVRLPKPILDASGITDEVDLELEEGRIVLMRPVKRPREGWAEAIEAMGPDDEDWSDWQNMPNAFDENEWTWPEDAVWPADMPATKSISSISSPSADSKSPNVGPARSSRRTKRTPSSAR